MATENFEPLNFTLPNHCSLTAYERTRHHPRRPYRQFWTTFGNVRSIELLTRSSRVCTIRATKTAKIKVLLSLLILTELSSLTCRGPSLLLSPCFWFLLLRLPSLGIPFTNTSPTDRSRKSSPTCVDELRKIARLWSALRKSERFS